MMAINKALVVDDSRLARVALTKLLTKRGLEVDTATCGGEALDYLRENIPDVVFIDYMMPDMTGFQTVEAINGLRGRGRMPMVMYTSQDTPEDRREALELGVCGFLTKPSSEEGLDRVLDVVNDWHAQEPEEQEAEAEIDFSEDVEDEPAEALDFGTSAHDPVMAAVPATGRNEQPADYPSMFAPVRGNKGTNLPATPPRSEIWDTDPDEEITPRRAGLPASTLPAGIDMEDVERRIRDISQDVAREVSQRVADQVARDARDALEGATHDWTHELEAWKKALETQSEDRQGATAEAAANASRDTAYRIGQEIREELFQEWKLLQSDVREASLSGAEKAARGIADSVARELAEAVAEATARRIATQLMEQYADQLDNQMTELGDNEAVLRGARDALNAAMQDLSANTTFQDHVSEVIVDRGVPLLKNALDHWVREVAEQTAAQTVRDAVARSTDAMVKEAIIASSEAAVRELKASQGTPFIYRYVAVAAWLLLAGGVAFSLYLSV